MYMPPPENFISILSSPERIAMVFGLGAGFKLIQLLVSLIIYDLKYYNGAGEDFLEFGKEDMLRNYYTRLILSIPKKVKTSDYDTEQYFYMIQKTLHWK